MFCYRSKLSRNDGTNDERMPIYVRNETLRGIVDIG